MKLKLIILLITAFIISCTTPGSEKPTTHTNNNKAGKTDKHSIAILPFKGVDSILIKELEIGLQKHLAVEISVLTEKPLPGSAFYKPKQRYLADSLLVFLRETNKNKFEKIIGVTTKDISTRKGDVENWGILGLGSCPGEACVVSTFRAGRKKVSYSDFLRRMTTLALHELGHTYGLEHCPVHNCLMKDAEGKMNLDDGNSYCNKCSVYLFAKGILK